MSKDLDANVLGDSICISCVYKLSRLVSPFNFDYYEFSDEELDEIERLKNEDGTDVIIEENTCLLLKTMLDCEVLECNYYKNKKTSTNIIYDDNIFGS
jgi:hypothetical protein